MDTSIFTLLSNAILVTIPTVVVAGGFYMLIKAFVRRDQEMRRLEIKAGMDKETRLLRLQAYERLILLLERMSPAATISRVISPDMTNQFLQLAMIRSNNAEFEHNLSQQLYVSSDAWRLIVSAKDEINKAIGMIAGQMPGDTSAQQAARVILESIAHSGQMLPNQTALEFLKNEARELI